jgi:integrase
MPRFSSPKPSIINSCDSRLWTSSCEQCALAKIQDLHFHNLGHTFITRLQDLGVDYEARQALLEQSAVAVDDPN